MKLVKTGETRSKELSREYNITEKDPSFYYNPRLGCMVVYKIEETVYVEQLYEGEEEFMPDYVDHVLINLCRSCLKTRPQSVNVKEYKPLYESFFDMWITAVLVIILALIIAGLLY